jgi:chemotaxis protein methyltransferase CheR
MTLRDALPYVGTDDGQQRVTARILATDVSTTMLARVRAGVYAEEALREVPPSIVRRHFTVVQDGATRYFQVAAPVHRMVYAARLNLVGSWPMQGRFDYIFCRNVMIYFDRQTRQELVQRLWDWLTPGGFLFIGHSESLAGLSHAFRFVQPAVYARD